MSIVYECDELFVYIYTVPRIQPVFLLKSICAPTVRQMVVQRQRQHVV